MPLSVAFNWAPQGTVSVAGSVTLKPELSADLKSDVTGFAILPLSPYLEQFVNARITQGTVTTSNTVHLALAGGVPVFTLAGDVNVEKFGIVDGRFNKELAGFAGITLKGLKASTSPQLAVSIGEVALTAPYARITFNGEPGVAYAELLKAPEKHVNLLAVFKPVRRLRAASTPRPPAVAASRPPARPRPRRDPRSRSAAS